MTTIQIPSAAGELIDKITILRIKGEQIEDAAKLVNVRNELALLTEIRDTHPATQGGRLGDLEEDLKAVNQEIWDLEDRVRDCERRKDFGDEFIEIARLIYKTNDRRAALKRQINDSCGSAIVEVKSYTDYS